MSESFTVTNTDTTSSAVPRGNWHVDFRAYAGGLTEELARAFFQRLDAAAEDILCGLEDRDHECPYPWTCGGSYGPGQFPEDLDPGDATQ